MEQVTILRAYYYFHQRYNREDIRGQGSFSTYDLNMKTLREIMPVI